MKMTMPASFLLGALLLSISACWAEELPADKVSLHQDMSSLRTYVDFDAGWLFSRGECANATMPEFDDSAWRRVNLPHDWSIEGPFSAQWGSGNGYAPGGIGFYRKHFRLDPAVKGKVVAIEFDGVYNNAEVWINGQYVGGRPYGYISFQCDLTPYLKFGPDENVVAVRVDHSRFADSRWYTGSGIYRNVRLRITDKLRIGHWGTFVTTPQVKEDIATVRVETMVENGYDEKKTISLQSQIVAPDGQVVASRSTTVNVPAHTKQPIYQQIDVKGPELWSLQSPALYRLNSRLTVNAEPIDETSTTFGIRTIRFDPDKGFFLNGKPLKLKGVCLHHDAGCLGAAVPEKVWERRLRRLKELGVNAVRTSHNPPAPELLELCDRMGLLVKDETFDEFTPTKNKWVKGWNVGVPSRYGYGEVFDQWSVADIRDMVLRDRNHPSIIMWSIGNELDYANDPFSDPVLGEEYRPENPSAKKMVECAKPLIEAVRKLDPTRPVTAALANVKMSDAVGLPELLDIVGYNYQEQRYPADHKKYPKRFIFGSENHPTYDAWTAVRDNDYICGQFLWTGIEYLGEAGRWPNRASSFGLLDLCGFKKPLAWFRQSLWSDKPMVYICASRGRGDRQPSIREEESWNWPENSTVTVHCFTNCPEAALTLNNKPLGTKRLADAVKGVLSWRVPFEPGILKVEGQKEGKTQCQYALKTAGPAGRIELSPDVTELRAAGKDICHLEFQIVDAQGVRVPDAENELTFAIEGPAEIIGIGNANHNDTDDCKDLKHKAYQGRGLAIVQSKPEAGKITVKVGSPGLEGTAVTLTSR
jgi:beta-galactosidase